MPLPGKACIIHRNGQAVLLWRGGCVTKPIAVADLTPLLTRWLPQHTRDSA